MVTGSTMSLDFMYLAAQPKTLFWHLTCIKEFWALEASAVFFAMFWACVASAHAVSLRGRNLKITQHARFGVLEWSPQTLPQNLEEVSYE
jgi:hypothetical protein